MSCGNAVVAIMAVLLSGAGVAHADVKAGVDAWAQGDFAKAVSEWKPLADAGDPDAQFNMGQAYKLGRGVPMSLSAALDWYSRAAAQGHERAEDNYGLLLFQQNRRVEAMPFLQRSAARGEPRAQYLVGTALFNGDLLTRDWIRAYALMSRAASAGLPQATSALAQMDQYVSAEQRKAGQAAADAMDAGEKERAAALASATVAKAAPVRSAPAPIRSAPVPASVPAASPKASEPESPPQPASAPAKAGGWRIQLGAFSEAARAEAQWKAISAKASALSGLEHYLVPGGGLTRLQAGPLGSRAEADKLCSAVKAAGSDCIPKAM